MLMSLPHVIHIPTRPLPADSYPRSAMLQVIAPPQPCPLPPNLPPSPPLTHSAMLHVVGDLVQSAGVALAGALIWYHEVWGFMAMVWVQV